MFTIDQIKEANLKVQTGADFPGYIQDLIKLGVVSYDTHVADGHSIFTGPNNFQLTSEGKYPTIQVADQSDLEKFRKLLQEQKEGKTHYLSFCRHAAGSGVEKWTVDTRTMTCTFFDKKGNAVVKEPIVGVAKAV